MKHDSAIFTYVHPELAPWALKGDLDDVSFSGNYSDLAGVPSEFTPEAHEHTRAEITNFPTFEGGESIEVTDVGGVVTIGLAAAAIAVERIPFDSILTSGAGEVLVSSGGYVLTSSS